MNISEHDPIARWMKASQAPILITDMNDLVMADIRATLRVKSRQRRYLAFAWLSFGVGAASGLWIASPWMADVLNPSAEMLLQVGVSLALVFGVDRLWRQGKELGELTRGATLSRNHN
jgi:hypothetical protein